MFALFVLALAPQISHAATFTVDSNLDTDDLSLNGVCDDGAGRCTLRAAITEANNDAFLDTVQFSGPMTITLGGDININFPVDIDASSVATCPIPTVFITGSANAFFQVNTAASGSSIRGLWLYGYGTNGMRFNSLSGATPTTLSCSVIGLASDGETAAGANNAIDMVNSSNIVIGGPTSADRNTISGNQNLSYAEGIAVGNSASPISDITFQNNYFGTDITGMFAVSNGYNKEGEAIDVYNNVSVSGVQVLNNLFMGNGPLFKDGTNSNITIQGNTFDLASNGITVVTSSGTKMINIEDGTGSILIGGSNSGEGNIFAASGVGQNAVGLKNTQGAVIKGNFFGIDRDGVTPLLNGGFIGQAINLEQSSDVTIGGTAVADRNIFLNANLPDMGQLIGINNSAANVYGNRIGINILGQVFSSATSTGISVALAGSSVVNIGGFNSGEGNIIAGQLYGFFNVLSSIPGNVNVIGNTFYDIGSFAIGTGTTILMPGDSYTTVLQNSIISSQAIDSAHDADGDVMPDVFLGTDANDYLDGDTGSNDYINHPILISAVQNGGDVDIQYGLDLPVSANPYRVDFYRNPSGLNASGFGPLEAYITNIQATVSQTGLHIYAATLTGVSASDGITATVTPCLDVGCTTYGGTSEASNGITGVAGGIDIGTTADIETYLANNNAYHIIKPSFALGVLVHADTVASVREDDRDGVIFDQVTYLPDGTMSIDVTPSDNGYVNVWFDVNGDGDFNDVDEYIVPNQSVIDGVPTNIVTSVPHTTGSYTLRVRLTSNESVDASPSGEMVDGEVEDYAVVVAIPSVGGSRVVGFIPKVKLQENSKILSVSVLNSGICPKDLLLHDSMKEGSKDGYYSAYNKKMITEVKILQAHINRILASQYDQAAGPLDGIFGPRTKQGVMRLQEVLNNVLKPTQPLKIDGVVGPFTRGVINNSCGKI